MALQRLTPDALFKPTAYTQVVVASGRRMVSMDAEGNRQIDQLCGRLQTGAPAVAYLLEVEAIAVSNNA